jgi:hypothetical protein
MRKYFWNRVHLCALPFIAFTYIFRMFAVTTEEAGKKPVSSGSGSTLTTALWDHISQSWNHVFHVHRVSILMEYDHPRPHSPKGDLLREAQSSGILDFSV